MSPGKPTVEPLGRQLVFTAKAMREAFEDTLAAAGGSLGTWVVLSALSDVGAMSQAALASHVHLEGATLHARLLGAVIELQRRVLGGLGPKERAGLANALATIQANLAALAEPVS